MWRRVGRALLSPLRRVRRRRNEPLDMSEEELRLRREMAHRRRRFDPDPPWLS